MMIYEFIYSAMHVEIDLRHLARKIKTRVFTAPGTVTLLTACRNL